MRLLSFLNQVEATLAMLRPEDSVGWRRRVNPLLGSAVAWHPALGLSLHLRVSRVAEDRHGLLTRWTDRSGRVLEERTFFCGPSGFDWQRAAEAVAELTPAGAADPLASLPNPLVARG
jgi:hypothetical protein